MIIFARNWIIKRWSFGWKKKKKIGEKRIYDNYASDNELRMKFKDDMKSKGLQNYS